MRKLTTTLIILPAGVMTLCLLLSLSKAPPSLTVLTHPGKAQEAELDLFGPPRSLASSLPSVSLPESQTPPYVSHKIIISKHSSIDQTLKSLGLLKPSRQAVLASVANQLSVTQISPGTVVEGRYDSAKAEVPFEVRIELTPLLTLVSRRAQATNASSALPGTVPQQASSLRVAMRESKLNELWQSSKEETPLSHKTVAFSGVVDGNLWNSASSAGMDPQLITKLSEVFAWQMDFSREVQRGDHWRLTVDVLSNALRPNQNLGFGDIIAAEYRAADRNVAAVRYKTGDGRVSYYAPGGRSLKAMFLKSPVHYARVTSGFSSGRFHPILKINKPHHGIDYGAPKGTPVLAVGDGDITYAAYHGGSGNMLSLRHNGMYETQYKHLSRFATGLKKGSHVHTGDVIGYVGATGLATGPHLHFEFHVNGQYVDPQSLRFPTEGALPDADQRSFAQAAERAMAELPPWSAGVLTQVKSARAHNAAAE